MKQKSVGSKEAANKLVKNIYRKTARKYSAEEKIRINTVTHMGWQFPGANGLGLPIVR